MPAINNHRGVEQYILFFTKSTDLSGYHGGFTPAHLWFILYLFIISLIALPITLMYQKSNKKLSLPRMPFFTLLILFIIPSLGSLVLDIGGKSLGEFFVYFMMGYFLLSEESILERTEKYRFGLLAISVLSTVLILFGWNGVLKGIPDMAYDIFFRFYAWTTILALFGLCRRYLNARSNITDYFSKSSFAIYVFHQTWIIAAAYYTFMTVNNALVQMLIILGVSVITTFATYELCKRIPVTRFIFGIKK